MANILLVEDDELISRMLQMRLEIRGHQIERACNGAEGVEKALQNQFDLVLMDMHMPVLDGHEATRQLREKNYTGTIVAVTASAMSQDSEKAIRSGCDYYIPKPVGEDFEDLVDSYLQTRPQQSGDQA